MSYSIHLYMNVDTGGPEPTYVELAEIGGYTSNVAPMWTDALGRRLADLKEKNASEALAALQRAVAAMEADTGKYEAMNPPNGWGDYEGALDYLRRLMDACAAHPKATIWISH
jgi:hypothetical protein